MPRWYWPAGWAGSGRHYKIGSCGGLFRNRDGDAAVLAVCSPFGLIHLRRLQHRVIPLPLAAFCGFCLYDKC